MDKIISDFTSAFAFENNLDPAVANGLVEWLQNEGALDYSILIETYDTPRPTFSDVVEQVPGGKAANDVL